MNRLFLLLGFIISASVAGLVVLHGVWNRDHTVADATADATNLRDALIEQTRQTFSAIDLALLGVEESINTQYLRHEENYRALVARQNILAPTFAIFVLDEEGYLAATSRTRNPEPSDFAADPMFTSHQNDPSFGLFIGAPRMGRVGYAEGKWIITVSRRLNHADGSFAGIVAAALSIDYLTDFYDALRRGEGGVVGIAKDDGTVIARSPFNEDYLGRGLADTRLFRELLPLADAGTYRARFVTDNADRITAYGRVPGWPLVVYVGISADERLAAWRQLAVVNGAAGLLAILVSGAFIVFVARRFVERQREQEARAAQLTKLTEVSTRLQGCPDVATALQLATNMARDLVPCHQAVTSLTEHPSMAQAIHSVSLSGKYAAWKDYDEKPVGSGIYRKVCETNRPMRLTQAELEAHADWKGFGAARDRHPPMRGWLAVPLIAEDGRNLGLIQLSDRESGEFTAEDQALMVELMHMAGVAIQRLKMADELRKAAATAEQLRLETEAARAAEESVRSEVEGVLNSIRDAVYALDPDWRFTFLNQQAEEWLERKADDLIGRNVWEEFPEAVESEIYAQYHKAREENVDVEFRVFYAPLKRWFEVRAFPQKEGGLTVYFQDISDWVTQEAQLRQSQKMEAVGQLTGGVAHDFNNLLTVILGNAETVLAQLNKEDHTYRMISMICNAGKRAEELTRRLLAFSRRQPLEPGAVDVNELLRDLEPLLARTLGEQYDIRFFCRDGIDRAFVDPGQLRSAIVNLAVNARDAMPGGGRLTVETTEVEIDGDYVATHVYAKPGRYVMIAVSDSGVGMTPETCSRAFEPFFTTKKAGEGTGLGLSMVYGFIKQSSGHVNIYSEPGEGTSIKLYLPCAGTAAAAAERGRAPVGAIVRGTERILVVEDDPLVREYTASALSSFGYEVAAVPDGAAARSIIDIDGKFELLLCDVILGGGMNGREVSEAARSVLPNLKVLYMTGYTDAVIVHHGRLDPGVRLLMKPFSRVELAVRVREALDCED